MLNISLGWKFVTWLFFPVLLGASQRRAVEISSSIQLKVLIIGTNKEHMGKN
jgi:hypothetical protein